MNAPFNTPRSFELVYRLSLPAAMVGGLLCALGWWTVPDRFFEAYLLAFLCVASASLGCAAVLMIHLLAGGRWGQLSRRVLEAGAWPLVLLPLAAVPMYWGIEQVYEWAHPGVIEHDPLLAQKAAYLNKPFFVARAVGYLVLWALLAGMLCGVSPAASATEVSRRRRRLWLVRISGIGLVLYTLTATFAAFDWEMSLQPHWFSAIYGVISIASQAVLGFALPVAALAWLHADPQVAKAHTPDLSRDLGTLLFAAVTFWMYVSFSQFLIIWSGNLPEEISWYLARGSQGWQGVAVAIVALYFVVPFVLLLSPRVKQNPAWLGGVAMLLLVMHAVQTFWLIMPPLRGHLSLHWLDGVCLITAVALWMFLFQYRLIRRGLWGDVRL